MGLTRREILKALAVTGVGGAVFKSMETLSYALESKGTSLIWVTRSGNDHHHLSLLGQALPSFLDLITKNWDLGPYDPIASVGESKAFPAYEAAPILVLEAIPSLSGEGTILNRQVAEVLPKAKAAILLGTEACFGGGGIPEDDIAALAETCRREKTPLIRLPGIPSPPHHLVGTLAHLEFFGYPKLDSLKRPSMYFNTPLCHDCERKGALEIGDFADWYGEDGCLLNLGCKGPVTHNSCAKTHWQNGENWCVGAGSPCTGCSEPGFPGHSGLGLSGTLQGKPLVGHSSLLQNVEGIALGFLGLVGVGVGVHTVKSLLDPENEPGNRLPRKPGKEKQ